MKTRSFPQYEGQFFRIRTTITDSGGAYNSLLLQEGNEGKIQFSVNIGATK